MNWRGNGPKRGGCSTRRPADRREPLQRRVLHPAGLEARPIAPALLNTMGSDRTDEPEYQMGSGCLADQLIGQYPGRSRRPGPLVESGKLPRHAREHLPAQLQAGTVGAR